MTAQAQIDALNDALFKAIGDNHAEQAVTRWIDTGNPELNRIISGSYEGGLPFGRMVEVFGESSTGKTADATEWMVRAQKMGGCAIFIDWERSFDVRLAEGFGLNTQRPYWIYAKPATWEEGNTLAAKACQLIRASKAIPDDAPILVVFDSIAAALPKSQAGKEIDEYTMNDTTALARVTSSTLKTMSHRAEEFSATFVYLNQMRLKPGVMFGDPRCLRGDVQIPFVDGTTATIKEIVKNKINKEVWSYNETTGEIEPKFIVDWHDNGSIADTDKRWIHIRATTPETKNGVSAVTATNDHKILTRECGWINAEDVKVGYHLVTHKHKTAYAVVTEVREGGKKLDTRMYDITIEGNHNFLAGNKDNGFIVHNCTPGGKAMEFYASARLALGRQKIMDKDEVGEKEFVGQNITVQCVKTKFTRPFQECNLRMMYNEFDVAYFDHIAAMLDHLIKRGWIEYNNPRVTWTDGKKYFVKELVAKLNAEPNGMEQLKAFLPKSDK
ncbi:recombinase [Acinetobacter baumannii]|uniref:recombinase n=1 Tax=Acinetobacter baumannii TaxID=470 RepID=UPI0004451645|nr:recombinase [Acinetobacter baumannii]EXG73036.1 intein C-terminal splicing region domain protein [Acinetobacter baumannii 24812_10]EXH39343.1 intein C-terminal splicing region domain protein [Acinetobacter baumannii 1207552]EXV53855.1 intein C-terminal splicing region domain protein [Acinetobacter baumannii 25935_7]EXV78580.1 intein C-terminal splicing region domain protein [Acinetobacter baumannii 25691_10]EYC63124.1 intein C-terminal splicing region domain protein [Acinetobacter baumannii